MEWLSCTLRVVCALKPLRHLPFLPGPCVCVSAVGVQAVCEQYLTLHLKPLEHLAAAKEAADTADAPRLRLFAGVRSLGGWAWYACGSPSYSSFVLVCLEGFE
jgi:hypothetical protein